MRFISFMPVHFALKLHLLNALLVACKLKLVSDEANKKADTNIILLHCMSHDTTAHISVQIIIRMEICNEDVFITIK